MTETPTDLADFAKTALKHIREHFPAEGEKDRQALCLADPDQFERHTALGDAQWARAIWNAVTGSQS